MTSSSEFPEAFFDMHGRLRSWITADPMPEGWTGIAKRRDTLFVIGREGGEMSYTALQAKSMQAARAEIALKNLGQRSSETHQVFYAENKVVCDTPCACCGKSFKPSIANEVPFDPETRMPVCSDCSQNCEKVQDPFKVESRLPA